LTQVTEVGKKLGRQLKSKDHHDMSRRAKTSVLSCKEAGWRCASELWSPQFDRVESFEAEGFISTPLLVSEKLTPK
jgi:hypothetical protein